MVVGVWCVCVRNRERERDRESWGSLLSPIANQFLDLSGHLARLVGRKANVVFTLRALECLTKTRTSFEK
jgi:hypothetical protein